MRKVVLSAVALVALTGAGVAVAQTHGAQTPQAGPRGPHAMFEEMDANHNGAVTRAEFDAAQNAQFARMDANHDGSVTREERRAAFEAMRASRPQRERPNIDANNDGTITRDEFLAPPTARFAELDKNRDGRLTGDEKPQRGMFGHHRRGHRGDGEGRRGADANRDGVITQAEHRAHGAATFERMDRNHDGQLTEADRPSRSAAPPRN